jgi:hypothetical protein
VELTPHSQYDVTRIRANFSEKVFDELFLKHNTKEKK